MARNDAPELPRTLTERVAHTSRTFASRTADTPCGYHPAPVALTTYAHAPARHTLARLALGMLAAVVLCAATALAFRWLAPATADAAIVADDSPYYAASIRTAKSTPVDEWEQGTLPHLYTSDGTWADAPFGYFTVRASGAAPACLAMAYVQQTGNTDRTPADFAAFATAQGLVAADVATTSTLITKAADSCGMTTQAIDVSERAIREALASGLPVIAVTTPQTFASGASCIVVESVNKLGELDIVDPTNAVRTAKSWTFDEIMQASSALFALEALS